MKFILPICVAGYLSVEVRLIFYKLAELVEWISQKEIKISSIESTQKNATELVCMIEKYFPTRKHDTSERVFIIAFKNSLIE